MNPCDILNITLKDEFILINSVIPLNRKLLDDIAQYVGERLFSKEDIWVILSSSCMKALVVDTKGNSEYARSLITNLAFWMANPKGILGLPFEQDRTHQSEVLNLMNKCITLQSLDDADLTPEIVKSLFQVPPFVEDYLKDNPYYAVLILRLKEDSIIDEDFKFKVGFPRFIKNLRQILREITTENFHEN